MRSKKQKLKEIVKDNYTKKMSIACPEDFIIIIDRIVKEFKLRSRSTLIIPILAVWINEVTEEEKETLIKQPSLTQNTKENQIVSLTLTLPQRLIDSLDSLVDKYKLRSRSYLVAIILEEYICDLADEAEEDNKDKLEEGNS